MDVIFDQLMDFVDTVQRYCAPDGSPPRLPERVLRVRRVWEPTSVAGVMQVRVEAAITAWPVDAPLPVRLLLREDCGSAFTDPERDSLALERAAEVMVRLELLAAACELAYRPWEEDA